MQLCFVAKLDIYGNNNGSGFFFKSAYLKLKHRIARTMIMYAYARTESTQIYRTRIGLKMPRKRKQETNEYMHI